ncbi:thermonuclease family protein [Mesorhizobium sp. M1B.F.Ca.ET.045.04.1.1]|uniref:thermonuclease family protein n=1 Tax=Mesorhizobium sp. M1B.F.Ca.ET.045.04.1.1 TaxID=2493673 RepID=UPI000F74FEA9|nr:thermonuclease family protein [Mesorhizobium sp. M1B.F.Ca.ET.045.04.1.1]AZO28357.1 thermonuclease family protein [Mesorhizobium sp. M1B.F.Ca.ET.045.04.1.1]
MKIQAVIRTAILAITVSADFSSEAGSASFTLLPGVTLETGDSWTTEGRHYRLYGVQACLRGSAYTDRSGKRRDCGEASLAVLGAYVRDTRPTCAVLFTSAATTYVACSATVGSDRLDLADLLIASGFAFAAVGPDGLPQYPPYAVVEQMARNRNAGLWQFGDVQHPAFLLARARQAKRGAQ